MFFLKKNYENDRKWKNKHQLQKWAKQYLEWNPKLVNYNTEKITDMFNFF